MSRLRVRIELNRRLSGVPLDKMASVVEETRKFFYLLSEDVHIEADRGEWLASDFDAESLNFTAEYAGPVSDDQVHAFGAAFSGSTSLRRDTIAQFTRIADFLGEDELVGFGLYQSDQETEPTEWRCLSKRDAMRFGDEIKLLAQAAGEQLSETQLPAVLPQVMNGSVAGRRLFKDRRESDRRDREALAADPSKLIRDMESNLSTRIGLLEGEVAEQTRKIQQFCGNPDVAEERFQKLLSAMETFWAQAPRQFLQLPAPAAAPAPVPEPAPQMAPAPAESKILEQASALALISTPRPTEGKIPEPVPTPAPVQLLLSAPAEVRITEPGPAPAAINAAAPAEAKAPDAEPTPAPTRPAISTPQKSRPWSMLGIAAAATAAILLGIAFPGLQRQWVRYVHVETLPTAKLKAPPAPALPSISTASISRPQKAEARPAGEAVVKTVAARTSEPFVGPHIPLDIPAHLKTKIQSDVQVDVLVAIDQAGNVTGAHVASTKGDRAHLLVTEALRAAKQARFRPAREGEKTVESKMVLTFEFKPELNAF
jgi:outer membrane biosynthesis protein TonB